jgi:hypothetical protein
MDARQAIAVARSYVLEVFSDEGVEDVGLEEVEYDETKDIWRVTLGFSRPWDQMRSGLLGTGPAQPRRSFKVVSLGSDGGVVSLKDRALLRA